MKNRKNPHLLDLNYSEIEQQLARDLGLSCSFASLSKATASLETRKTLQASSDKEELEQLLAGKTGKERMALVRANKERIRACLGLIPTAGGKVSVSRGKNIHRRLK